MHQMIPKKPDAGPVFDFGREFHWALHQISLGKRSRLIEKGSIRKQGEVMGGTEGENGRHRGSPVWMDCETSQQERHLGVRGGGLLEGGVELPQEIPGVQHQASTPPCGSENQCC